MRDFKTVWEERNVKLFESTAHPVVSFQMSSVHNICFWIFIFKWADDKVGETVKIHRDCYFISTRI